MFATKLKQYGERVAREAAERARREGRQEGRQEGREEGLETVALRMLDQGRRRWTRFPSSPGCRKSRLRGCSERAAIGSEPRKASVSAGPRTCSAGARSRRYGPRPRSGA